MKPKDDQPHADRRLAAAARRQCGVGETGIKERVRTGRLIRLHRGVFALGYRELRREGHWLAAVLACGPGAVLSHVDAAAHWNIRQSAAALVHVTVPTRAGRVRRRGLRIHRSGQLAAEQVTVREGIPVTTVARTLLDLADVLGPQDLERAVHESEYLRLFDLTALTAVVGANPGRRGARLLAAAHPPEMTKTELEHPDQGLRSGLRVAEAKVIVETDGFAAHGTRRAFEADRVRDRRLGRAGFRTIRLTPRSLAYEAEIVADLEAMLPPTRVSTSSARAR